MNKVCKILLCAVSLNLFFSYMAVGQNINPAMLEQFKNLPAAQQKALAKQYGIDLEQVLKTSSQTTFNLSQPGEMLQQNLPVENHIQNPLFSMNKDILKKEETPRRYGKNIFNAFDSYFAPTDDAQIPNDYILGVGDQLNIQMFGKKNEEYVVDVNRNGSVTVPSVGPIDVIGITFESVQKLIQTRIADKMLGVEATVSMAGLRSINVFLAGEVTKPGAYSLNALATVTQALFQAGGISDIGSVRNIQVKRNGKVVNTFDLYELLLKGNGTNDVRLRTGDVVFVPTYSKVVTIDGEVKRPMQYELLSNETLNDLIKMAGGYSSSAFESQIILTQKKIGNQLPQVLNIDASESGQMQTILRNGDVVRVNPISDALENAVSIEGAAIREGMYGWTEGLRVSDLISDIRRDLGPYVDINYAIIVREHLPDLTIDVHQFRPLDVIISPHSELDPILQARDRIIFFDYEEVQQDDDQLFQEELVAKLNTEAEYEMLLNEQLGDQPNNIRSAQPKSKSNKDPDSVQQSHFYAPFLLNAFQEEDERPDYSRKTLLTPIINRLKAQSNDEEPVAVVSISGAVKSSGEYPLAVNGTFMDLINAAGGLKDSAHLNAIELRRLLTNPDGTLDISYINLDLTKNNEVKVFQLASKDHINVRVNQQWNPMDTIEITGEVRFPGVYLIQPGERLSDVVARAGGLKRDAFAEGAIFSREEVARLEQLRARNFADSLRRDFAASLLTEESVESTYTEIELITRKLEMFEGQGRLLIDLPGALSGDTDLNIEVVNGDTLHIPKRAKTVTVVGEVRKQGTHTFQQSLDVEDYLTLSAGITTRADFDAIYIVKANGSVVIPQTSLVNFNSSVAALSPGDTIIVPVDGTHKESISLWRDITQIIYQGTVAIAAVARL